MQNAETDAYFRRRVQLEIKKAAEKLPHALSSEKDQLISVCVRKSGHVLHQISIVRNFEGRHAPDMAAMSVLEQFLC